MNEDSTKAIEELLAKFSELTLKVTNLANKLDEHIKEADAHNPGFMYKKK